MPEYTVCWRWASTASLLDWEASFPFRVEWRRTDMATNDKEEQCERTEIADWKQRELDF